MTTIFDATHQPTDNNVTSAAWLASRALPHLRRSVELLETGETDQALGSLSAALTRIRRAQSMSYAPKLIVDGDGNVLWAYRVVRPQDRAVTDRWESDLAEMCACLLSVGVLPDRVRALDPALEV